jgi:hypothetical protein
LQQYVSIIAGLLVLTTLGMYIRLVALGRVTPNPTTVGIRTVVMGLNSWNYTHVVQEDHVKALITYVATTGLFTLFVYCKTKRKFGPTGWIDWLCFTAAVFIIVYWRTAGNAIVASAALQVVLLLSLVPTVSGLIKKQLRDVPYPWLIASCGYGLATVSLLTAKGGYSLPHLIHPIVSGVIGNASVALTIALTRSKNSAPSRE